jgi:hypothetical protein
MTDFECDVCDVCDECDMCDVCDVCVVSDVSDVAKETVVQNYTQGGEGGMGFSLVSVLVFLSSL